jgi:hypothetical protein
LVAEGGLRLNTVLITVIAVLVAQIVVFGLLALADSKSMVLFLIPILAGGAINTFAIYRFKTQAAKKNQD